MNSILPLLASIQEIRYLQRNSNSICLLFTSKIWPFLSSEHRAKKGENNSFTIRLRSIADHVQVLFRLWLGHYLSLIFIIFFVLRHTRKQEMISTWRACSHADSMTAPHTHGTTTRSKIVHAHQLHETVLVLLLLFSFFFRSWTSILFISSTSTKKSKCIKCDPWLFFSFLFCLFVITRENDFVFRPIYAQVPFFIYICQFQDLSCTGTSENSVLLTQKK